MEYAGFLEKIEHPLKARLANTIMATNADNNLFFVFISYSTYISGGNNILLFNQHEHYIMFRKE